MGTYSSTTSDQTYRKINDYLGLNGANTLLTSSAFANANVNKILAEFRPSYLRFPGGDPLLPSTKNRAFHFDASPDNVIFNNFSDNSITGFKFSGNCTSTDQFKQNAIGNHDFGLVVDDDAIMGTQDNTGNEWTGSYSTWAAKNFETAAGLIALSRFDVCTTGSFSPPSSDPAGWINPDPLLTYTPTSINNYDCDGFDEENSIVLNGNDQLLASGEKEFENFPNEEKYIASQILLDKIKIADAIAPVDELFIDFKDSLENTSINYIDSSQILIEHNKFSINVEEFNSNLEQMSLLILESSSDEIKFDQLPDLYSKVQGQLNHFKEVKSEVDEDITTLTNAANENLLPEVNEKYMLEIYKKYFNKYNVNFTIGAIDTLITIAFQCPLEGGKAVFRARAVLRWVTDTLTYDDAAGCANSPLRLKQTESDNILWIDGNPLNTNSTLQFKNPLAEKSTLRVVNLQGQAVITLQISANTNFYSFSELDLSEGMYLLKLTNIHQQFNTVKLIVQ